jgi:hypothetical protein
MCQTIVSIALDTATSALSLPRRLASRRYFAPRKDLVLAAARAETPSWAGRVLVAPAGGPGLGPGAGLVDRRAALGPGHQVRRGREAGHVRADLGEDHLRAAHADPVDLGQPADLVAVWLTGPPDLGVEGFDVGVEGLDAVEHLLRQQRVVVAEPAGQGLPPAG